MTHTSLPGTPGSLTRIGVTYAIPVIRVSKVGKRGQTPDKFKSPGEQMERITNGLPMWCPGEHVEIAEWIKEMDVSGYRLTLSRRKGLLRAVEMIEAGAAKILIVAYFNRLCRNGAVKREVVQRVEAAGGRILAIDMGAISHATAAQWLTSEIVMVIEEYYSRQLGERLGNTQKNSIAAGVPIGTIPPGYAKDEYTRRLKVVEAEAEVMREVFSMRADGASLSAVRKYMARHGIVRSLNSVRRLLHSEAYLGHLVWGKGAKQVRNDDSHKAIISQALFDRVQRIKGDNEQFRAAPGRKSTLLLSGVRVLRCETCGGALATASGVRGATRTPFYRCNPTLNCTAKTSINARIADAAVIAKVKELLADLTVTEGVGMELIAARAAAEEAQAAYSRAQRNLVDSMDEDETKQILKERRDARDAALAKVDELELRARRLGDGKTINAGTNWNELSLDEQRALVADVLERVVVTRAGVDANGRRLPRGAGRLRFIERGSELL